MTSKAPPLSSPASSSSAPKQTTPSSLLLFPLLLPESASLLARCIRFLPQSDRVRAACSSKHVYQVCASEASWVTDGGAHSQSAVESAFLRCRGNSNPNPFSFNGPALSCAPSLLFNISRMKLFREARCLQLRPGDHSYGPSIRYMFELRNLEQLSIGDGNLLQLTNVRDLPQFPATLRSLTFGYDATDGAMSTSAPEATKLLSLLPATLESLQIILRCQGAQRPHSLELNLKLGSALAYLTNLKRLTIISPQCREPSRLYHAPTLCEIIKLSELQKLNLRIFTDTYVVLADIAQEVSFASSMSHLHISHCSSLHLQASTVDVASYFPKVSSMHIDSFGKSGNAAANLPSALGAKIKTLLIHEWVKDEDSLRDDTFAVHGLTNLTSLTINHSCPRRLIDFDSLATLTHLSTGLFMWDKELLSLTDFEKMRNLRSLEMNSTAWRPYLQKDGKTPPLEWNQIADAVKNAVVNCASASPSSSDIATSSLVNIFPSLTELTVRDIHTSPLATCYEARRALQTIPHLKSVKWGMEPQLHPNQIETYYSAEAILDREVRKLQQEKLLAQKKIGVANSEAVMEETPTTSSIMARHFNMFNLSLVFQSLTPLEVARASLVSQHWHSAALSPHVLRHHIRVEMHQLQGAKVHGPQIRIHDLWPMIRACNSAVFRNLRVLTLGLSEGANLPRESKFAHKFLRLFMHIPRFTSLHTLALNWQLPHGVDLHPFDFPSLGDIESIKSVMESPAVKHLKVFRIIAPRAIICILLQFLPMLKGLEVVELRYNYDAIVLESQSCKFAQPLLQIPTLKQLYVAGCGDFVAMTLPVQLEELRQFCCGVSDRFDEVMWRVPMTETTLDEINRRHHSDASFSFPHLKSIHITSISDSLNLLSDASDAMPHLNDVSIGSVDEVYDKDKTPPEVRPLSAALAARLRSLKLMIHGDMHRKGRLMLTTVRQLASLISLSCLHIFRRNTAAELDSGTMEDVNSTLAQFILRCTNLTELNCPSFDLKVEKNWSFILQQLRVVYHHSLITPVIQQCQQLREYHSMAEPSRDVETKLLALPHFQFLTFGTIPGQTVMKTRVYISNSHAKWKSNSSSTEKRAQQLLEASGSDYQALAASWQRVNEIAKTTAVSAAFRNHENADDARDAVDEARNLEMRRKQLERESNSDPEDDDLAAILSSLATS